MIKGVNGHFYYTSDEAGENQSQVQQANSGGGSALAIGKGSAVVATKKSWKFVNELFKILVRIS